MVLRSDAPAGPDGLNGVCGIAFSGVDVGCRDRGDAAGRRCVAVEAEVVGRWGLGGCVAWRVVGVQ